VQKVVAVHTRLVAVAGGNVTSPAV